MFSLPPSPRYSEIRLVECCAGQYRPWVVRWRCYLLLLQSPTNTQFSIGTRFYILKIFFFSPVLISALIKFFKSSFFIQIIFKIWIFFCCKNWPISASRQGRRGIKKDNQFGKTENCDRTVMALWYRLLSDSQSNQLPHSCCRHLCRFYLRAENMGAVSWKW